VAHILPYTKFKQPQFGWSSQKEPTES
jgi:hypothetical protein